MTTTTDTLFDGSALVEATAADYCARLDLVRAQLDTYSPEITHRRAATDEYHDTSARIRGARQFLAGDFDSTYAGPWGPYTDVTGYREHYANDSLRAALHHLVWCEHYAGLRDRDSAMALDPWRN